MTQGVAASLAHEMVDVNITNNIIPLLEICQPPVVDSDVIPLLLIRQPPVVEHSL